MADEGSQVDPRGEQPEVRSIQSLIGALLPALIIGILYLVAWWFLSRRFCDIYDCKRRRLDLLREECKRNNARPRPRTPGWPEAFVDATTDTGNQSEANDSRDANLSTTLPAAIGMDSVPIWPPQAAPPSPPPASRMAPARTLLSNNPFVWLVTLWRTSEKDIIECVGSDAYMFLRFLRLGCWISLVATVLGLCILLPVNVVGGNHLAQLERLSLSNVADQSSLLWVPLIIAYLLGGLALYVLHREYIVYVELRQRYLRAPTAQNYSVLVRDIPQPMDCDALLSYLRNLLGEDVAAVHCVNRHRRARYDRLTRRKDAALLRLARAENELQATGGLHRPVHRDFCHVFGAPFRLLPAWGPHIDTIGAMENEIGQCNRLLSLVRDEREALESLESQVHACILTLGSVRVATASKTIPFQPRTEYFSASEAPAPAQLLWQHICSSQRERYIRNVLVWSIVAAAILGYTVPVAFASSLANLTALSRTQAFTWLRPLVDASPALTAFIQGFLPPLIVVYLLSLVPSFMKALSRSQHLVSDVECENAAIYKVFLFALFDIFLAYTIAGSFLSKIQQVIDLAENPSQVSNLFATTLPAQSTFFMTYIALAALSGLPGELSRLGALVMISLKKRFSRGSRSLWDELNLLTQPMGLHELYNLPLVVFLALVTYSTVAPLVSLFALLFFALAYPVYVHQLMYVYQPTSHTGGTQWPIVSGCCVAALLLQQVLLLGIFSIKRGFAQAALLLPLLVVTVTLGLYHHSMYTPVAAVATLESLASTDIAEYGPTSWTALKQAYSPYSDKGQTNDVSKARLYLWTEPYGVLTQGVFSEGQRVPVSAINTIPEEELSGTDSSEQGLKRAQNASMDYGTLAGEDSVVDTKRDV
ncbi:early-responsive to dehydration 4 [Nannochloropsis gaditana]|uniref:Early-responsive to dehydration 4 n=1 Tax=Nannochloropsis gaditana TaxID=72520 RepID=W7TP56_9STRA|nr:early-responsive to dehydration 4 [Nannochloropsis gaditana]